MEKKEIVVIGGSAGSVDILMKILPALPEKFPLPVIVVIHRKSNSENLLEGLLQDRCKLKVTEVDDKLPLEKGIIYIAPAGYHLLLEKEKTFALDTSDKINYSRPCIDVTMESITNIYHDKVLGILLTGANADGAIGMKLIKENGGMTIVQTPESCLMKEMPTSAINLMEPDKILDPIGIEDFLSKYGKN